MNDKLGFSIGTTVDPYTGVKPLPDLVALDLCKAYPVPGGNLLLRNTVNGKRVMVQPEVFATLLECVEFRTIDQHTARIITRNPAMKEQQQAIKQVLNQMLETGMLVSAKATCDRLMKDSAGMDEADDKLDDKPVAAIITWERPEALKRLLESIVRNCETKDIHHLYVIDDSRSAENIEKNQQLVASFTGQLETPLTYFGREAQTRLIDALAEKLPQHEQAIRFLIDTSGWQQHWTAGLNRNLALMLSFGRRLVMLDDDAVCDVYDAPNTNAGITFSDFARDADCFASEAEWAHLHQPLNPDPIKRHMQCLGLTFSNALGVLGNTNLKPSGFRHARALEVHELEPTSPILMTECGSLGCPGTVRNTWLPDMSPASLEKMLKSEQKTNNALKARKVWSGRNHPHFSPRSNMSQITGFDNRELLPPYLPIMRGQDRLFGHMLSFIHPSAVTLDYPWAVPHLPLPERQWRESDLSFKVAGSFPRFFFERILSAREDCLSGQVNDRLAYLSAWFKNLAAAPDSSLTEMYRQERLDDNAARLDHLDKLLKQGKSTPVNWQNYLRNGMQQLNTDLDTASREDFEVSGYPANLKGEDLIDFWRGAWTGFAEALTAWPDIREAARSYFQN
jgi:hypothetical protein